MIIARLALHLPDHKIMILTMNWTDLSFKASDVVKLCIGLITAIFFASSIKNSVSNVMETVEDIRQTQIDNTKSNTIRFESIQNQLNLQKTDIMLMNQRLEMIEKTKK